MALVFEDGQVDCHGRVAVAGVVLDAREQAVGQRDALDLLIVADSHVDAPSGGIGESDELACQGIGDGFLEFDELPLPAGEGQGEFRGGWGRISCHTM